ncbi:MAG: lactate utilization protein, partial [Thermoplasmata archaeon]
MAQMAQVIEKLNQNGFHAQFFSDITSGVESLIAMIPEGARVGIGGSVTVRELDIINLLKQKGCTVVEHWTRQEEDDDHLRREALSCEYYISSANAITEAGHLVNIDGIGNRIAALAYGPKVKFIVAGRNKIVKDLAAALWRIKNVAAPPNARRVGLPTPCAES